jgi:hypothetical protein
MLIYNELKGIKAGLTTERWKDKAMRYKEYRK